MPEPTPSATREDHLIEQLAARYRWRATRRPSAAALVGSGLIAVPPLVFLAQALLPAAWLARPFALLYVTLATTVLAGLLAGGFALLRKRKADAALEDLRAVYRQMFAHRCERHEDERREALLSALLARVRRMADRLSEWDGFAESLASVMQQEASTVEHALFEGAIGRRNVLVANRQRLHPQTYSLASLEADISGIRQRRPVEEALWHADPGAMLPRLRERLRGGKSLLDASPEELITPIREFCAGVVRPYLCGEIADLGATFETLPARETADFFDALMERSAILYRPADPPRAAVTFVAAREDHQPYVAAKGQSIDPVTLRIEDREWLGVLRILPGGATPSFGLDEIDPSTKQPAIREPTWVSQPASEDRWLVGERPRQV
jgi:hypothetical protein